MFLNYNIFYRKYGIRRAMELFSPRIFEFSKLVLPRDVIYHHDMELDSLGPSIHDSLFLADHSKIPVDFCQRLISDEFVQKRKFIILVKSFHDYVKTNDHKFVYDKNLLETKNIKAHIALISYTPLKELYVYRTNPLTPYYEWYNLYATQYYTIDSLSDIKRQQFVVLELPYIFPSYNMLKMHSKHINRSMLRIFDDHKKLNVLDFFRFIDPETRHLSTLSKINKENYKFINIIFKFEDLFYLCNLGQMIGYTEAQDNHNPILEVHHLQKMFIKSLMLLHKTLDDLNNGKDVIINNDQEELNNDPDKDPESVTKNVDNDEILNDISDIYIENPNHDQELNDQLKILDQDMEEIEKYSHMAYDNELDDLEVDNNEKEDTVDFDVNENTHEEAKNLIHKEVSNVDRIKDKLNHYKSSGILNSTDYRSNMKALEKYENLKSPYDPNLTINEYVKVSPEELKIKEEEIKLNAPQYMPDPKMAKATTNVYHEKYVKNVMSKDIMSMVTNLLSSDYIVDDYQIDRHDDMLGSYENHTIKIKPIYGQSSTLHFKVPVVNDDGELNMSGKKYYLRMQRQDLPIRKINDRQVALTSYYGKTFVNKDEKVVNNISRWLGTRVRKSLFTDTDNNIINAISTNVFNPDIKVPNLYSALAQQFLSIETPSVFLYFDYNSRDKYLPLDKLKDLEQDNKVFIGYEKKSNYPIFINFLNELYLYDNATFKKTQSLYELLGIDEKKVPVEFTTVNIFSKSIPLVIVLGYLIGFENILKYLNTKYRLVESNKQSKLESNEYEIKFKDYKLVLDRKDVKSSLILGGFRMFEDLNKNQYIKNLNNKDIYFDYYKYLGLTSIYLKETDLYNELYVDPVTLTVLKEMNEPTTFIGLLFRASEMLILDNHPSSVDMDYMRLIGHERISGIVYKELVSAVREHKNKNVIGRSSLNLNPYAVWKAVNNDAGIALVSDANPFSNLKQQESVTFSGSGGRSKDTLVARDRIFNESDVGVISEATSDSSDAGVNVYLTANPAIKNLRGMKGNFSYEDADSSNVLSSTATYSSAVDHDGPERVNFISIQYSHTTGSENYRQSPVRTGYEYVIPQRTKSLYCLTAKKKGKVISLNDKGIIVEYEDGEKIGAYLGKQYGDHEGSTFQHNVTTNLQLNDTVLPGMAICFNPSFFEPDILDPKYVVFKSTKTIKVALLESQYTFEDSSAVSKSLADELAVKTTHIKSVVVSFKQNILKPHPLGEIKYGDILCYIEDEITSNTDIFNEENIETLKALATNSPKCKYNGTLDKIEVIYHGDKEDMSASLRKLADISDKELKKQNQSANKTVVDGSVNSDYRVDGNPLLLDTAEIRFYITNNETVGIGDKLVFANQMKSVVGKVINEDVYTEEGEKVDAIFGSRSVAARIVTSPYIIGTATTILKKIASMAVEMFEK